MTSWYPAVTAVFNDKNINKGLKVNIITIQFYFMISVIGRQVEEFLQLCISTAINPTERSCDEKHYQLCQSLSGSQNTAKG